MTYFLLSFSDIGSTIAQALRTFCGRIAAILYNFIVVEYDLFMYIARAEILDDQYIQSIYNKVGMLLGIFMLFKLTFSLIQSLVNPDTFTDQKKGFAGIIQRSVIAIVLLGITPSLFDMAFDIQNLIVGVDNSSDNVIYKLIVGNTVTEDTESFGHVLAADLFFSFYRERTEGSFNQGLVYDEDVPKITVYDFDEFKQEIRTGGNFNDTVQYLTLRQNGQYIIEWDELFSIAIAIAVIWLLVIYCIQVATRVVQLAYLQLIAPVPILSYISDPDGAFKNWIKQCTTTYLDLFIRLAIIYFIIVLSGQILGAFDDSGSVIVQSTGLEEGSTTLTFVKIFLVLGLLMFGKRVPELLKDLFPNLGGGAASLGFGLKTPKKLLNDIPIVGGATNKVLGYAGKGAKWGWNKTGGRGVNAIKNRHKTWKDDRTAYREQNKLDKESSKVWNEYGAPFKSGDFEKAFSDSRDRKGEYAASYRKLEEASAALKGYQGDTNTVEYRNLLAEKEKAQKNHDVNREKYKELARREDQLKRYKNRHPDNPQSVPTPAPNPQPPRTPTSNGNTVTPAGIEVVESNRPQQPSRTERERQSTGSNPQDEHSQLVERYNNATDPAERDRIRREIDDFERRH